MSPHIVICGAGFGGLELTARLSAEFGREIDITLIDKNAAFIFGFSKFEIMFGRQRREDVSSYYAKIAKAATSSTRSTVRSAYVTCSRKSLLETSSSPSLGSHSNVRRRRAKRRCC